MLFIPEQCGVCIKLGFYSSSQKSAPFSSISELIGAQFEEAILNGYQAFGILFSYTKYYPHPLLKCIVLRVSWLEQKFIICSSFCIAIVYVSISEETLLYGFRGKSISADVHGVSTSCELLNWDCSRRPHNFAHAGKYPSLKFRGCLHGDPRS